jgi:hypothetical protein
VLEVLNFQGYCWEFVICSNKYFNELMEEVLLVLFRLGNVEYNHCFCVLLEDL